MITLFQMVFNVDVNFIFPGPYGEKFNRKKNFVKEMLKIDYLIYFEEVLIERSDRGGRRRVPIISNTFLELLRSCCARYFKKQ